MSTLMDANGNDLLNVERGKAVQNGDNLDELMKINRLKYNFPQDLSLMQSRTFRINYSDLSQYLNTAGEAVIRLTASTEYLIGWNSYIRFTVNVQTTGGVAPTTQIFYLPNDIGGLACFERLLIESNDGSEIERIDNVAHYARNKLALKANLPYIQSIAEVAGINGTNYLVNTGTNTFTRCSTSSFLCCIPLYWFAGIFEQRKLIPAQLISGMRIRLQMSSVANAFMQSAANTQSLQFSISNLQLMADSVQLSPMIERKLLQTSGSSGLDFYYNTAFYSGVSFTSSSIAFEIYKSVSRANGLLFITQSQSGQTKTTTETTQKPTVYGSTQLNMIRYQLRLGSQYYPQQPLTSGTTYNGLSGATGVAPANAVDMYYQLCVVGPGHCYTQNSPAIPYTTYLSPSTVSDAGSDNKYVACWQTLEKASMLELSGMPVNNSRGLVLSVDYAYSYSAESPPGQILRTWLLYTKLCKIFANNCVIKE